MNTNREPIGKLISQLYRQNQKFLVKELLPYGIGSGGQHIFLKLIVNRPGITQDQMTNEMKFDKATTARSVKKLEEAGYIERRTDPKDRRSSLLYPTPRAVKFAPVLQSILADLDSKLTFELTEEEADQLVALLQKVSKNSANL
ncbi:MarR family winged helix-turn-helix transcriptional regulator [Paenibacillus graminis]|uniref:MarR family winged helix-turn-helix transcriptional regulator n=1 Tax=Paenibacillus graminis TaxID=189425 RepID=UPI002DBC684A|nr:MarR family transcriptional regulator [Paenibacillus graminis]MEC0169682.1 MarR family transcriptional regulator [Paenibacillus graminis]